MRVLLFSFAGLCIMACTVQAQFAPNSAGNSRGRLNTPRFNIGHRFRREEPQGSVTIQGTKPLDGPDRRPSLDLNYNHRLIDNGKTTLDAFGGGRLHGSHVSPHAGLNYEHRFNNNMFLNGQGQFQPGPRGGISPSAGVGFGWRFRREAFPYEEEDTAEGLY